MLLPIFPPELTLINERIGFQKKDGRMYYFNGMMPIFSHHEKDLPSFRFITAQLVVLGNATQAEIVRSFGISTISMKRYVKRYQERGPAGFFEKPRRTRRSEQRYVGEGSKPAGSRDGDSCYSQGVGAKGGHVEQGHP